MGHTDRRISGMGDLMRLMAEIEEMQKLNTPTSIQELKRLKRKLAAETKSLMRLGENLKRSQRQVPPSPN